MPSSPLNWFAVPVAALVPLLFGALWYHPSVFGKIWMREAGMTDEKVKGSNMLLIFCLTLLFSLMLSLMISILSIHQMSLHSLLVSNPDFHKSGSELVSWYMTYYKQHGAVHRTFGHGALHGGIGALFMALPILGTNALYERKSWKYMAVNIGYWAISFSLMGGILCAWT